MPRKPPGKKGEELNPRQAKFVAAYGAGATLANAANAAGYSPKNAANRGAELLRESTAVQKAVAEIRNSLIEKGKYGLEQAMKEAEDTVQFARDTGNANAMAKAVELRAKLNGLLVDKIDHRVANFQLNIGGIDDAIPTTSRPAESEEEDYFS